MDNRNINKEKIHDIIIGNNVFIRTDSNKIFSYGSIIFLIKGNNNGELFNGNVFNETFPKEINIIETSNIKKISLGVHHTCFLDSKGKLLIVGRGVEGQLGKKIKQSLTPIEFRLEDKIIDVCSGYYHNLVLTEKGDVYSFGNEISQYSELIRLELFNEKVVKIFSGYNHSIILTEDNIYGHGNGIDFQLGNEKRKIFYGKELIKIKGIETNKIEQILIGFSFTCIILND
jgi:alpha-tubulin suppressor-like RCC1 family protein